MTASRTLPASEPHLLIERRGHVLIVTMNRPEARNALCGPMLAGMRAAWDEVDARPRHPGLHPDRRGRRVLRRRRPQGDDRDHPGDVPEIR